MSSARLQNLRLAIHRWRYPLIFLLIVLLGGMAVVGNWVYGKIRNRQAYALAGQAAEDLKKGNINQARMGVDTALRLKPGHPAATRLLARIQASSGEPEKALGTFQKLTDERQLSLEDLKLYATLASDKGEHQLAKRLADFAGANGAPAFPHLLQARIHTKKKETAEVEASLRAAVQAEPGDETRAVLLDFLISNRRPGESVAEIAAILEDFSTRDNSRGAQALAMGLRTGLMNPDKRGEWIEKLRAHPQATIHHRILADTMDVSLRPASKPEIAARLQEFAKPRSLEDRTAAARWLAKNGTADQAFSILPLEDAIQSPDSFVVWLDTNAMARNWAASLEALARPDNPLLGHHTNLFQGLALRELGKTSESQAAFQRAVNEAGDVPERFAFVTVYLFGCGETSLFEQNLAKIPGQPLLAPQLFPTLFPAVKQRGDALLSLRVLETLGTSFALADNSAFQNELAHHRILLDKKTPLAFIRKHCEENPNDLSSLATLAFHRLKKGDAAGAMALFDSYGPDVDARSLPPRILCIYSATLAANGKTDLARKIASIIPRGGLSRQEAEFLIARLKPAN